MKKRKSFMAGILSLLLAVCTLFGSLPVYAAEQVYTDAPEKAGTIVKVKNDGTEDSSFSESIMNADGETAYCIQLGKLFEPGYKTKKDAATEMTQEQITNVALCLEYVNQYAKEHSLSKQQRYLLKQCLVWRRLSVYLDWGYNNVRPGYDEVPEKVQDEVFKNALAFAKENKNNYKCYGYVYIGSGQNLGQFFAEKNPGKGKLKKESANPAITDGNNCYSLSGAEYTVYSDKDCTKKAGSFKTDKNGVSDTIELNEGTYYVKETKAPKGFSPDSKVHSVKVTAGETATVKVTDIPKAAAPMLTLEKLDAETGSTPQGAASLAGAQFEWHYYDGYYTKDNLPSSPTRTWVTQTKAEKGSDGKTHYVTALSDAYKVSGDAFYTQDGKTVLPLGTITVKEKQAPTGYLLEGAYLQESGKTEKITGMYAAQIKENGDAAQLSGANSASASDQVIHGGVKIQKRDADTGLPKPQGASSLKGTEFTITSLNENPVTVNGKSYAKGQAVLTMSTDASGLASTDSRVLPYGHYKIAETKAPKGYLAPDAPVEFDIKEDGKIVDLTDKANSISDPVIRGGVKIQKRDAETKGTVPQGNASLENAEFSIVSLNEQPVMVNGTLYEKNQTVLKISSDASGLASAPADALPYGHYQISESGAPRGYIKNESGTLEFDITENGKIVDLTGETDSIYDPVIRGGVKIQKRDLETREAKAQGGATLEGAEFTITTLCKNPVLVDGKAYENGQVVATLKTDASGSAVTAKDLLPYGHYRFDEIKAPEGYLKDGAKSVEFDITENGKIVDLTEKDSSIYNQVIRGDLELVKVSDGNLNRLASVPFSITSVTTGESHTIVTDKNGYASTASKWNKHTQNTNQGKTSEDGIWFGTSAPDDSKGALPYDTYTIEEQRCTANEGMNLLKFDVTIYKDAVTVDLGTLTDDYIEIGTTALDKATGSHLSQAKDKITLVDTVEYSGLKKGQEYRLTGILMDAQTGEPLLVDGKKITAEKTFTAKKAEGKTEVSFTFDASGLSGKTTVVFEELYQKDLKLAVHADLDDTDQQVSFPQIQTSAKDSDTGEHMANADEKVTLTDTVSYKGLIPHLEYVVNGTLMDKETGEPILIDKKPVTAQTAFTPETNSGTVEVTFTFDATTLKGKTTVVFESITQDGKEVAVHADLEDESQQIFFPEIGTKAECADTGTQIGEAKEQLTIKDTVSYHLIPGKEYKVSGTLMDKETNEPVLDNGKPVTSELVFTPEKAEGSVELAFTFDASALKGKTVVAFETVSYLEKEVAVHADIEDEGQSIYFPEIGTQAKNADTGEQMAPADKEVTLTDTITYKGLIPELSYTATGTLMDKESGKELLIVGKPVTSKTEFTPKESNGTVEVSFTFDASSLKGKTIVVFESVTQNGKEIAVHADLEDEGQQILFPEIGTKAGCPDTGSQTGITKKELTIKDTVTYHLIPGREYRITGTLMDKETKKALKVDGKKVTSEIIFTPEEATGSVELTFTFDASALKGKTLVAFESVSYKEKEIAVHADIEDEGQSIFFPEIRTTAKDGKDGDQKVLAEKETTVVDTITYKNLVPGTEYKAVGTLMDKKTGKAIEVNGKAVTAEAAFKPEKPEGTIEVSFKFDATSLSSGDLVVFEKLYDLSGKKETEITSHEDIKDKGQTITLEAPKKDTPDVSTPVRTGDDTPILLYAGLAAAALLLGAAAGVLISKNKKNSNPKK